MNNMQACTTCGVEKELSKVNFYKNSSRKSGFVTQCKICLTEKKRRNTPVIYKITNTLNGKIYIGKTINKLEYRYNEHFSNAEKGGSTPLYQDMKKQGLNKKDFPIKVIEHCSEKNIDEREKYWIFFYREQKGILEIYNLQSGGMKGRRVAEETRVETARSSGTLDYILVYNWMTKKFIGRYSSCIEAINSNNLTQTYDIQSALNEGYFVGKDMVFIYEFKKEQATRIMSEIERHYPSYRNIKEVKDWSRVGEKGGIAKLTESDVFNIIHDLLSGDANGKIANKYNISRQSVTDINYRRTWSHISIKGHERDAVYKISRRPHREKLDILSVAKQKEHKIE